MIPAQLIKVRHVTLEPRGFDCFILLPHVDERLKKQSVGLFVFTLHD